MRFELNLHHEDVADYSTILKERNYKYLSNIENTQKQMEKKKKKKKREI